MNLNKRVNKIFNPQELKTKLIQDISQLYNEIPSDDSLWEEEPVSPDKFILHPDFFGDSKDNGIYPHVIEDMVKIFSGEKYFPHYRTVLLIGSPGDGKSTTIAFALAYLVYLLHCLRNPFKYFGLKDISSIALMGMAPTGDKAKRIVFNKVGQILERVQWFKDKGFAPDPDIQSELRFHKRKVSVRPGNSSKSFPAGEDIIAGVIDEAQLFIERYDDPCEELYSELKKRSFSRFPNNSLIFLAANANVEENFIERLYDRAKEDPSIYACRRPVYLNPRKYSGLTFKINTKRERTDGNIEEYNIDIPYELEREFKENPREAVRTWCAIPHLVNDPYLDNWDRVLQVVNRSRQDPLPDSGDFVPEAPLEVYKRLPDSFLGVPNIDYYIHIDLATGGKSGRGDACGFTMGHRGADVEQLGIKLPTAYIDLTTRFKGGPDSKIDFDEVRKFVQFLKHNRNFNIVKVTFDGWQSHATSTDLMRAGFEVDIASANKQCYDTMKTMLYGNRVDFYPNTILMRELKRLERRQDGSCDHPPGGGKDISDCFARVCYMITEGSISDLDPKDVPDKKRARIHRPILGTGLSGGSGQNRIKPGM